MEEYYQLSNEFSLKRCTIEEFAAHWAIYSKFSAWDEFQIRKDIVQGCIHNKDSGYWIMMHDKRIGGVLFKVYGFGHLFFEPPFLDYYKVLRVMTKQLRKITDSTKMAVAFCITSEYVDDFLRCGFFPNEVRRRMIRATEKFNVKWNDGMIAKIPEKQDIEGLVKIYLKAYSGSREEWLRSQEGPDKEIKEFAKIREKYMRLICPSEEQKEEDPEHIYLPNASTAIYFENNGKPELIGCCLVSLWKNAIPLVYDIFVSPEHQGKGLGARMLKHALTKLTDEHEFMQLFVIKGNTAESLYHNLGFKTLEELPFFIIPANPTREE